MPHGQKHHADEGKTVWVKTGDGEYLGYAISSSGYWQNTIGETSYDRLPGDAYIVDKAPNGEVTEANSFASITQNVKTKEVTINEESGAAADQAEIDAELKAEKIKETGSSTSWGSEGIGKDDFIDPTTKKPRTVQDIYGILDKKLPGITGEKLYKQINEMLPKYESYEKEEEFAGKTAGLAERQAWQTYQGELREFGKAEDVYGLGAMTAERGMGALEEQYGLGVSAAERGMAAAGDVYGAAQETYGLGQRRSERGLESGLGQIQAGAGQLGAQMRGAYGGGMGGGMRGAMGAQATMAKGLGQTYGAYTDTQTALTGAKKRAESAYGRAEGAYADERTRLEGAKERGLGTVSDEMLRIEQERGYAGEEYGITEKRADLAERKGQYGLEESAEMDWESQMGSFLGGFKQGGRVPSKETFLKVLTGLPDAGGS